MITGVRGLSEIESAIAQKIFDSIVWIDNPRVEKDPTLDFGREKATDVILNDGSWTRFFSRLLEWARGEEYIPS